MASAREALAHRIAGGDARLEAAFGRVPRERFLPPGIPAVRVYADETIALGPPGLNNGQPSLHAMALRALAPRPDERALHVGAGSGYYTSVLAQLCREVIAYEVDRDLAAWARRNLSESPNIKVETRSGVIGPLPEADVIYVNCGATGPQPAWIEALRPGGRLLFPLTADDGSGSLLWIERPRVDAELAEPGWPARLLMSVAFVPCAGARRAEEAAAVGAALERGAPAAAAVRRLHRGVSPAAGAWCAGEGWWLGA